MQLDAQRNFGRNLRAARMEAGLEQSEVATLAGITQQHVSLIEGGQQNLIMRTMAVLAKVVGSGLLDLLTRSVHAPRTPD